MNFPGNQEDLKAFLDSRVEHYNRSFFIELDPVSIPHLFTKREDIEIMGFLAAILAWGQRPTIISKCQELVGLFENEPYSFVKDASFLEIKKLGHFRHRTFNGEDLLYFLQFFRFVYLKFGSLENAFFQNSKPNDVESALNVFRHLFISQQGFPQRTGKHISAPSKKSACKRLNMFLRWMVRKDKKGVDFGIWNRISPADLICPCDLHVDRVARKLGLIQSPKTDWKTAVELTENLKVFDPLDPVKYDFALFGLGVDKDVIW